MNTLETKGKESLGKVENTKKKKKKGIAELKNTVTFFLTY
jgi:hypothetical protein